MLTLLTALAACQPPPGSTSESVATAPPFLSSVMTATFDNVPLVRQLHLSSGQPAELIVTATAADGHQVQAHSAEAVEHAVALVGLKADRTYDVEVVASNAHGQASTTTAVTLDPLPANFPTLTVHHIEPERIAPGFTMMPITKDDRSGTWLVVVDEAMEVVWLYDSQGSRFHEALPTGDGGFRGIVSTRIIEVDWLGQERVTWRADDLTALVDASLHHEIFRASDGRLVTLVSVGGVADDVPVSYDDPTPRGPADVAFDEVLAFEDDGSGAELWPATALLDTSRIGYDALKLDGFERLDIGRSNAIAEDVDNDAWLVSVRHQDAILSIDRASGELDWILANPEQWTPELEALRLQPIGDVVWPYHPHGLSWLGEGRILMFDNGNERGTMPFSPVPKPAREDLYSRVVIFEVDAQARTVREVWSFEPDPTLFSASQGDADELANGNILADFAYVRYEGGVANEDLGYGFARSRILEIEPISGDVVLDLEIWEDGVGLDTAWYAYRTERFTQFP